MTGDRLQKLLGLGATKDAEDSPSSERSGGRAASWEEWPEHKPGGRQGSSQHLLETESRGSQRTCYQARWEAPQKGTGTASLHPGVGTALSFCS